MPQSWKKHRLLKFWHTYVIQQDHELQTLDLCSETVNTLRQWMKKKTFDSFHEIKKNRTKLGEKICSELDAMIHTYGPAKWFFTLSPAEWQWTDLREYLITVNRIDIHAATK